MTYTIGFAGTFYTLWEVAEPQKVSVSAFLYKMVTKYAYLQNLSKSLKGAEAKVKEMGITDYAVDLTLCGSSSFIYESPLHRDYEFLKTSTFFEFGRLAGTPVLACSDAKYLAYYWRETHNEAAENKLLELGWQKYDGEYLSEQDYLTEVRKYAQKMLLSTAKTGYHFKDGERLTLTVMKVDSFSFEGRYGTTFVQLFMTEDGELLKYIGSSSPGLAFGEWHTVKATIEHVEYKGSPETRLKRIFTKKS